MSQKPREPISRFIGIMEPFSSVLEPVVATVLAVKTVSGVANLSTLIKAGLTLQTEDETIEIANKLLLLRRSFTVAQLKDLLAQISQYQSFKIGDVEVKVDLSGLRFGQPGEPFWVYNVALDGNLPKAWLSTYGNQIDGILPREEWENLDRELRTRTRPPFDGIEDLAESYLGYKLAVHYSTTFNALLTLPINILSVNLVPAGELNLTLQIADGLETDEVELTVIAKGALPSRQRYRMKDCSVSEVKGGPFRTYDATATLHATNPQSAVVHLIYGGLIVKTVRAVSTRLNPRLRLHRMIDPDDGFLRNAILGKPWTQRSVKESKLDFEEAVAILLHLGGLQVERPGKLEKIRIGSSQADILGFNPSGDKVIVAACVALNPKPEDITKLAARVLEATRDLEDPQIRVHPVLFTLAQSDQISQGIRESSVRDGVKIVDGAALRRILFTIEEGASVDELFHEFELSRNPFS